MAMESFARALRALPTTICDNAGLDSAEIVANLKVIHISFGRLLFSAAESTVHVLTSAGDLCAGRPRR